MIQVLCISRNTTQTSANSIDFKTVIYERKNIEHVNKFRYLDALLDRKLPFEENLDYIKSKFCTDLIIFKQVASTRMMSEKVRYRLFDASIRPHLQLILKSRYEIFQNTNR